MVREQYGTLGSRPWAIGPHPVGGPARHRPGPAVGAAARLDLRAARLTRMPIDLVIDIENTPGALAQVAAAISDAGVNIAAATCVGPGERAELHILVPHAEAARHSLAISHLAVTREREVVVVEVEDRPGVLADLTRKIAKAGVNLDLVYVATSNRVVFGSADLDALRAAFGYMVDSTTARVGSWNEPSRPQPSPRAAARRGTRLARAGLERSACRRGGRRRSGARSPARARCPGRRPWS